MRHKQSPAGLVGAQHDDMAPAEVAVLVELGEEAGPQVCVKIDYQRVLASLLPAKDP